MLPAEGVRQFSLRGRGRNLSPFLRRRRRRRDRPHSRGRGIFALGGRENARCGVQGRAPPGAKGKRGQDTKVSCPLLRLPNFPLSRDSLRSRV